MKVKLVALLAVLVAGSNGQATLDQAMFAKQQPRLAVVISIDQFRADYLTRYRDLYLPAMKNGKPGGFLYLMETGAWFTNAKFQHFPTYTGPGHAVIGTGAPPYLTGIVGNEWLDRRSLLPMYCVLDLSAKVIGGVGIPMSPKNLLVSTFGDELKRATGGKAMVVSISMKDRAAILMAGRLADDVVWLDKSNGHLESSDFYCRNGKLPDWAQKIDDEDFVRKFIQPTWDLSAVGKANLDRAWQPDRSHVTPAKGFGARFPHPVILPPGDAARANDPDKEKSSEIDRFTFTPWGNDYILTCAERAIGARSMGGDEVPDSLTINLSPNDYLGHRFGPDSPEVLEMCLGTDHALSDFFGWLDKHVTGGLDSCLITLTADHGVAPIPEEAAKVGFPVGRTPAENLEKGLADTLNSKFPGGNSFVVRASEQWFYFDHKALAGRTVTEAQVEDAMAEYLRRQPGIFAAYTRTQFLSGSLPHTEVGRSLERGFLASRCGDVVAVVEPWWQMDSGSGGTSHGQPFTYDQHVALLMRGPGIKKGIYTDPVSPEDIAPTIATILGVAFPSAAVGKPIGIK